MQAADAEPDSGRAQGLRASGLKAEAKALALDARNSEALAHKAYLIDPHDWVSQEALFKSAIAAKPLDCGCEHYGYGLTLAQVGRVADGAEQFRAATDMLALWPDSQLALAEALVAVGKLDEAKPHFDAAIDLSRDSNFGQWLAATRGTETRDYTRAIAALRSPRLQMPAQTRAALLSGYQALASGDAHAKSKAIGMLLGIGGDNRIDAVATMLAALGASREALGLASQRPWLFWARSMRGALNDPGFPAVANQLGLMRYWKTTHTRPDICQSKDPPPFCRII